MIADMVIPDEVEPTIGWRAWTYTAAGLVSPQRGTPWPARQHIEAECLFDRLVMPFASAPGLVLATKALHDEGHEADTPHAAPMETCNCGIHATAIPAAAQSYATGLEIVGTVKLWGRVVEGEWGWRAQYAYPNRLWLIAPSERAGTGVLDKLAGQISDEYGVPVEVSTLSALIDRASEILPVDEEKAASYQASLAAIVMGTPHLSFRLERTWLQRHGGKVLAAAAALNLGSALLNLLVAR